MPLPHSITPPLGGRGQDGLSHLDQRPPGVQHDARGDGAGGEDLRAGPQAGVREVSWGVLEWNSSIETKYRYVPHQM